MSSRRGAAYERTETPAQRFDRNFAELLQELRVAQTGVQILFAFLLALAFQPRFEALGTGMKALYLVTLLSAAFAAVLLIAPVAAHRLLFARGRKDDLVVVTARLASAGLVFLGLAIVCAVMLIVLFVAGGALAAAVTAVLAIVVVGLWVAMPLAVRRRRPARDDDAAVGSGAYRG